MNIRPLFDEIPCQQCTVCTDVVFRLKIHECGYMRGVCVVYKHFREIDRYLSYPIAFLWSIDNPILVMYFYIYHLKYWPVLWATIAGFCVLRHWYVVTGFRQYMNASSSTTHVKCVINVGFFYSKWIWIQFIWHVARHLMPNIRGQISLYMVCGCSLPWPSERSHHIRKQTPSVIHANSRQLNVPYEIDAAILSYLTHWGQDKMAAIL